MRMRRGPSKAKGLVTTATVSASSSLASEAITGAAPVPVPPPSPAVTKTMSAPCSSSTMWSVFSSAAWRPISGFDPAPRPLVILAPSCSLLGTWQAESACRSVSMAWNSTPSRPSCTRRDHGVAAAAADADHLDPRAAARFFFHFVFQIVHVRIHDCHLTPRPSSPLSISQRTQFACGKRSLLVAASVTILLQDLASQPPASALALAPALSTSPSTWPGRRPRSIPDRSTRPANPESRPAGRSASGTARRARPRRTSPAAWPPPPVRKTPPSSACSIPTRANSERTKRNSSSARASRIWLTKLARGFAALAGRPARAVPPRCSRGQASDTAPPNSSLTVRRHRSSGAAPAPGRA